MIEWGMGEATAFAQAVKEGGPVFLLAFLLAIMVIAIWRRWFVPGWLYDKAELTANEWMKLNQGYQLQFDRVIDAVEALQAASAAAAVVAEREVSKAIARVDENDRRSEERARVLVSLLDELRREVREVRDRRPA